MQKPIIAAILSTMLLTACGTESDTPNKSTHEDTDSMTPLSAPIAKKVAYEMELHGDKRIDNYYWLRDDERKSPEVLSYLNAENAYLEAKLAHTKTFQENLFEELTGRLEKDKSTPPVKKRGYWYYRHYEGENEYAIYARKKSVLTADEEILIDANKMAGEHEYFNLGTYKISTNNMLMAYSTDTLSRRVFTIRFQDLSTGTTLPGMLEGTTGSIVWANDNKSVFYIARNPQTLLGDKVYRHKLGTPQSEDILVYEEKDKSFYTMIGKTKDDSIIYIFHHHTIKSGASIIDADKPDGAFRAFHEIRDNLEIDFAKSGDDFYIRTNWKARNFRLMKVAAAHSADMSKWVDVVPAQADIFLTGFELFRDHIVVREKEMGQTRMRVLALDGTEKHVLKFDDPVFAASFNRNPELDSDQVRISYSSMTTPDSIYDYNLNDGSRTLIKQEKILGNFKAENYNSKRIFITAGDGKEIPVSIVYRKDKFTHDGTNPLYQYAYGSYGSTIEPRFSSARLSLLDRGFVYAIAHIRGGQMLGREWYEDGKLYNKINSFTDFIDVTRALGEQKYGAKDKIFAVGGSAGGLLMGAVVNMAPDLYRGVVAAVPFVDVVTTMLDTSIPLTTNEYDEWGNPNEKGYYDYMKSYSPYDQVKKQNYPNMLVTTGLHDSQVQYFEPAKWVAKLRDYKTGDNLLLLKTNMEAGHGGASGRYKRYKDIALEYIFFFDLIGITE